MLGKGRPRMLIVIAVGLWLGFLSYEADAQAREIPTIGGITHHIGSITPTHGPHGSAVSVRAEGFEPNRNYHIAIGETQGCGYQVCAPVRSNAQGQVVGTVEVPEWTHTYHYEVVMIMGEDFEPVAVSDPFHVTDADGRVERRGVIGTAWPGCPSLGGEGGVTYALVGRNARTLLASEGEEMVIEGRIVDGVCTMQYAIEVESMRLPEGGGGEG